MTIPKYCPDCWSAMCRCKQNHATAKATPPLTLITELNELKDLENIRNIRKTHEKSSFADIADIEGLGEPDPICRFETPDLPSSILNYPVGELAKTVADSLQVPIDFPFIIGLGTISAATRGRVKLVIDDAIGHRESLALYLLPILPSGSNKSSTMNLVTRPLKTWDSTRARDYYESGQHFELEIAQAELERVRRDLGKPRKGSNDSGPTLGQLDAKESAERNSPRADLEAAVQRVEKLSHPDSMLIDDTTPEALVDKLAKVGPVAMFSSEGGFIANLGGRYSNDTNLDGVLKAHDANEAITVDRKNSPSVRVPNPFLTLVLGVQPDVLREIRENAPMMRRGFLARFLISQPDSKLGSRVKNPPALTPAVLETWAQLINELIEGTETETTAEPRLLTLSRKAHELFLEFRYDLLEPRLEEGSDLAETDALKSWSAKLPGQLARIAGLLELSLNPKASEVTAERMKDALELGPYFIEHSKQAHTPIGTSPEAELLQWLETHKPWLENSFADIADVKRPTFSTRQVHDRLRKRTRWAEADSVRTGLAVLAEKRWIVSVESVPQPGRPTELWAPNPSLSN